MQYGLGYFLLVAMYVRALCERKEERDARIDEREDRNEKEKPGDK